MNTNVLFEKGHGKGALGFFLLCVLVTVASMILASVIQTDFGRLHVSNVTFSNYNGIPIRAKMLRPDGVSAQNPLPGVVYIHGYQNNRETGDAYCIELARRGFVVLNIDAIGRGNSGIPNDPSEKNFDPTYGGLSSFHYLRSLPFVKQDAVGMMGHSLGAEMAYEVALKNPDVHALVITGFAYREDATHKSPKNMLMILGRWDEFRERMTGTRDIEKEWMGTEQTQNAFPVKSPEFDVTYGDFADGSARRVFIPATIHIQESHSPAAIAQALQWMKNALQPPEKYWIAPNSQIWQVKEWSTLIAMLSCIGSLLPLGLLLLRTGLFKPVQGPVQGTYSCSARSYIRFVILNGLLMWLFLPLIFLLFAIHIYVVSIDGVFPMMMVNGIVWWFLCINLMGFFFFRRWFKKKASKEGITLNELGISFNEKRFALDRDVVTRTLVLAGILFLFAYGLEHVLEGIFIVDFRFIFPFASDLTPYRAFLFLVYLPFIWLSFILTGIFLHGELRRPMKKTWQGTFFTWSASNTFAMVAPLILFLMIQYIPLFAGGHIPFVGPGGMCIAFVMNLFHVIGVLLIVTPVSTWFYQLTGKIYLGATVNAFLVTWMFVSSQVIAPPPV